MNKLKLLFLSEVSSECLLKRLNKEFDVIIKIEDLREDDFININILWIHLNYKIDKIGNSQKKIAKSFKAINET